jgi:hypothetical protein
MENEKPNYFAIIPAVVRYDNKLKANEKLLYGEIASLSNKEGYCFATNKYFADLYNVSVQSISQWINHLVEQGHIEAEIIYKEGSKEIAYRKITPLLKKTLIPIKENFNTPIKEKFKDNNINNIIINNNNINNNSKFKKPTLDEVKAYIKEKGYNVDAETFFNYFETSNWVDSKGNKVKNWKQKLITWNSYSKQQVKQNKKNYIPEDNRKINFNEINLFANRR